MFPPDGENLDEWDTWRDDPDFEKWISQGECWPYYWRVRARLPERKGQRCRVLVRGKMNSCLVEFQDGFKVVTSRNYLRRVRA